MGDFGDRGKGINSLGEVILGFLGEVGVGDLGGLGSIWTCLFRLLFGRGSRRIV